MVNFIRRAKKGTKKKKKRFDVNLHPSLGGSSLARLNFTFRMSVSNVFSGMAKGYNVWRDERYC